MKIIFCYILFCCWLGNAFAQQADSLRRDSGSRSVQHTQPAGKTSSVSRGASPPSGPALHTQPAKTGTSVLPAGRTVSSGGAHRPPAHAAADSPATIPAATAVTTPYPPGIPSVVPETPLSYRGFLQQALDSNAVFSGGKHAVLMLDKVRPRRSASGLFYIVTGVFLLLGIIRLAFGKYFSDLFRAFLNPTLSQRQLKDQLSQTPFPAFLLNIFFSVSLGVYLFLILQLYDYIEVERPLYLVPVFIVLVAAIYLIKYLFLRLSGWLFGLPELLDGYIFTIYLVHKVLGVILLPFLLLLAFGGPELARSALYISLCLIVLLVGYRYLRIYNGLHNHIYFSKFHFFLYLCAFEIAPVLIVGKGVLIWLNGTS